MINLSATLADHVISTSFGDLPPATVTATIRALVDAMGVMHAASSIGEGTAPFAELALASGGVPEARLIGRAARVPLLAAALANGALAHAIDFEDALDGAPVHPNAAQIPAALALADTLGGVSGKDLLTALAVGCDLVCRLGLALEGNPDEFGFYPPALLGAYGAVAACARIAGLNPEQTVNAFSILLCSHNCSSEHKYSPASDIRAVRDAFGAQAALQAVMLAQRGVRGFELPFEGKAGFFALFARGKWSSGPILDGLGCSFYGERLSFKPWPSCRGTHAAIEAILQLSPPADQIEAVKITGGPIHAMLFEPRDQKRRPQTAINAKFSTPFTVATAILKREVDLASFSPAALQDPDVTALAERVHLEIDPGQHHMTASSVEVRLFDGTVLKTHVQNPLGHPDNALSDSELDGKFRMCANLSLSEIDVEALLKNLRAIEYFSDVSDIMY